MEGGEGTGDAACLLFVRLEAWRRRVVKNVRHRLFGGPRPGQVHLWKRGRPDFVGRLVVESGSRVINGRRRLWRLIGEDAWC